MGIQEVEEAAYSEKVKKLLLCLPGEEKVKNLQPDFKKMMKANSDEEIKGVIVTSQSDSSYDFISRFFPPWMGIEEDPVTGAAHTVLGPYWSSRLGKKEMKAFQASSRGGEMTVRLISSERVELVGKVVTVIKGKIFL
ncbi:PhzF family phenazine biosynthesis protein [bacterium]|nr:PhzF family phenazine biosynthesis protein [bacterium]